MTSKRRLLLLRLLLVLLLRRCCRCYSGAATAIGSRSASFPARHRQICCSQLLLAFFPVALQLLPLKLREPLECIKASTMLMLLVLLLVLLFALLRFRLRCGELFAASSTNQIHTKEKGVSKRGVVCKEAATAVGLLLRQLLHMVQQL